MITLENNRLKFSFPGLADELRQLISVELDRVTNRLIAEDRAMAFNQLLKTNHRYSSLGDSEKREMREALLALKPEKLRQAILSHSGQTSLVDPTSKDGFTVNISFQRTLRIPDDGKTYPLPPGLGAFPLRLIDDNPTRIPASWLKRGGVMLPIYQAEALWLAFKTDYPCALKVGTGKINAVSGASWTPVLGKNPQDYVILPEQPWLDGYCVKKGCIRQFVAMPIGEGYTAEEQVTGSGEHGGIQLQIYPLKAKLYFEETIKPRFPRTLIDILPRLIPPLERATMSGASSGRPVSAARPLRPDEDALDMGLGAGGRIRQEIYQDGRPVDAWDSSATSRCFVHLCNSVVWQQITGQKPPHPPFKAAIYAKHGLPWFDYYRDDIGALHGSSILKKLKSVFHVARNKVEPSLVKQESVEPTLIIQYGQKRRPDEVREWVE